MTNQEKFELVTKCDKLENNQIDLTIKILTIKGLLYALKIIDDYKLDEDNIKDGVKPKWKTMKNRAKISIITALENYASLNFKPEGNGFEKNN